MGERDTEPVIHNNSAATEEKMSSQSASIGVNLRVTGQCSQGGRKYMEDFFSVAYQRSENAKDLEYAFVGIYDGHGGSEAATFAKEHLMMEIINQKLFWSDCDHDVLRAIREGYIATHYAMWREQEKWPKTATGLPSTAGTTATVAFIRHQKIYIGHVGDSGIVLGYQNENENFWRARQLTQDHKPESQAEKARIMRSGGKVVVKSGVPRVVWNRPRIAGHKGPVRRNTPVDEIPFLAVARSLGDLWSYNSALNEFVVSPDPDVKVIKINPKTFRCLIFGTDGLWNVVSAQDAVDTVREKEMINERLTTMSNDGAGPGTSNNQWTNPSKGLVEKAIKTWSSKKMRADNTSVVTVILYPPGKNISDNSVRCQTHSYGLEYTQVNAEIPTLDDENFSQSSADKFLPPEEYRNYVYDEEDRDFDCHSCVNQYYSTTYAPLRQPSSPEQPLPSSPEQTLPSFISTQNQHHPQQQQQRQHLLQQNYVGYYSGEDIRENCTTHNYMRTTCGDDDDEEIDADDDGDGDDDDNGVDEDDYDEEGEIPINNVTINENHTYMNSFAESYNSLLTSSLERENSATSMTTNNSSSDGGYHTSYISLDIQRHQDLEIEQHQYQQQCMSDEEGYSLTKLETRGEQQLRCNLQPKINEAQNQIQTFQIYTNGEMDYPATYDGGQQQQQYNPAASETICNYSQVSQSFSYDNNSYLSNYEQTSNCYVAPNLELTSLLQQELEEEKLVEIERSRNMAKTITTEVVSLPESEYSVETIEDEEGEEEEEEGGGGEEGQGSVVTAIDAVYDANEMDTVVLDETIQINEISSSVLESPVSSPMDGDVENKSEEEEKDGLLQKVELNTNQCSSSTISSVEKLLPLTQSQSRQQPVAPPMTKLTTQIVCLPLPLPLPPTKVRSHFPNIPNENRTSSRNSNINGQFHKLSSHHRQQQQQQQQHQNGHQRYEKRQLRSTIIVDYTKRTLRSRNSLSKDMKAKSASSAVISKPLRLRSTGAASAAVAAAVEAQYQNFKPTSAVTTAAVSRIANVENRRIRQKSSSSLPSSSPQTPTTLSAPTADISAAIQHSKVGNRSVVSINLRSRQIVMPLLAAVVSQSSPVTASAIQQRQQRSGRNLSGVAAATAANNNANTRRVSVSSKSPNAKSRPQESTYSKTTRLQGATPNLTSPPPQPKIISNSMTMTRARSLLSPKSMSVSVFSKRSSLRNASGNNTNGGSDSGTGLGINSVTVVAGNHQTKSRVQKRLRR